MQRSMLMSPEAIKRRRIEQGHDCLPGDIFLDLPREDITRWADYLVSRDTGRSVAIIHCFLLRDYENLCGVVQEIIYHRYGYLVRLAPEAKSFWENWPIVKIWVPDQGVGGILY